MLPTRDEISPFGDLDSLAACENFHGKSLADVEAMLRENARVYEDDLMHMGPAAFRFYFTAVSQYVRQADTIDDGFIAWLATVLESRLEYDAIEFIPIASQVVGLCDDIINDWLRFAGADRYAEIKSLYPTLAAEFAKLVPVP